MPGWIANRGRSKLVARLRGAAGSCRGDEAGSAIVEFALVAPMFFFLMFVIAQTAMVFIAEQVLDNAVFSAARLIRTGQAQNGGFDADDFRTSVCDHAGVFLDCDELYLDVNSATTFSGFNDLDLADPVDGDDEDGEFEENQAYQTGGPTDIVVVRAYYQWSVSPIIAPLYYRNADRLTLENLANGKRLIGAFAAFRNEPYS